MPVWLRDDVAHHRLIRGLGTPLWTGIAGNGWSTLTEL
jgi:hypothetical protein